MNGSMIFCLLLIPPNAYEAWTTGTGFFWFVTGILCAIFLYELTEL